MTEPTATTESAPPRWLPLVLAVVVAALAIGGASFAADRLPFWTAPLAMLVGVLALTYGASRSPLRGFVLPGLVVATAVGIGIARWLLAEDDNEQTANVLTAFIGLLGGFAVLLWLLACSPLRGRARISVGALVVVLAIAIWAGFRTGFLRFEGVTGNLVPRIAIGQADPSAREAPTTRSGDVAAGTAPTADASTLPGVADSAQAFGPQRDGKLPDLRLARDWTANPPEELWRRPVGAGWSGFAVAGRRALTLEQFGTDEGVVCYDLATGEPLWVHTEPEQRYDNGVAGVGPRTTPTIVGETVFTMGATGIVLALDLATGDVQWRVDVRERFGAEVPEWGFSSSPLVADGRVIVAAGGRTPTVALDAATGATTWASGPADAVHWSSPVLATLGGVEQVLMFHAAVTGHALDDGRVLWSHAWRGGHPHVAMPTVVGDERVLVSSGYGTGSQLLQLTARDATTVDELWPTTTIWKNLRLKSKFANFVVHDGHVYGLDDGKLACLELDTGRRRWKQRGSGHGQLLLAGNKLLVVVTETGEVLLVEATPERYVEHGELRALDHNTWNPHTLAGRYLLVRSDREAVCYRLPVAVD